MWSQTAGRIVKVLRPKTRPDGDVAELVRGKLPLLASEPQDIAVEVEHGCVVLRGAVSARERAHLVRAVAIVRGVDSVIDLLHERESGAPASERPAVATRRLPLVAVRAPWPRAPRLVAAGAGAGLALAGARVGGALGIPLALAGVLLFVRAATGATLRRPRSLDAGARAADRSELDVPAPGTAHEVVMPGW